MSQERARRALRGEPVDRIPLFDLPNHPGFLRKLTGIDPFVDPETAIGKAVAALDVDLLACEIPTAAGAANDPHLYGLDKTEWRHADSARKGFFDYDPLQEHHFVSRPQEEITARFTLMIERHRRLTGDSALSMAFLFTTCIHYAAEALDWIPFLMACCDEEREADMISLLDRFEAASTRYVEAIAQVPGLEVMLSHDDLAMNTATVQSPVWLRRNVIERYGRIWKPLLDRGIPVLHMSDGNYLAVAGDIAAQGASGFFVDAPCMSLSDLAEAVGRDKVFYTGPSPATLTVGSAGEVRDAVRRLAQEAEDLPRFFFHLPGGWVHNMPTENVQAFYEACQRYGVRD